MQSAPPTHPGTQPLVLIVDDEAVLLGCLELVLLDAGYRILTAEHGVTALRVLSRESPDAIVLDLQMPLMDGLTFAREYALLPGEHAPIILLTASDSGHAAAQQIGAAALIEKPFDIDALVHALDTLLGTHAHGSNGSAAPSLVDAQLAEASG